MPLILAYLFADEINTGGIATGGGLAAIAIAMIPVVNKIIDWRKEQSELNRKSKEKIETDKIQAERDKRAEDAASRLEYMNLLKQMAEAISDNKHNMQNIEDAIERLLDNISKGMISIRQNRGMLPPPPPEVKNQ